MTRTQILLEAWQHKFLSTLARRQGTSLSGLIREWVDEKAAALRQSKSPDPILGIVGRVDDPADDVSENTDLYLYGPQGPSQE